MQAEIDPILQVNWILDHTGSGQMWPLTLSHDSLRPLAAGLSKKARLASAVGLCQKVENQQIICLGQSFPLEQSPHHSSVLGYGKI